MCQGGLQVCVRTGWCNDLLKVDSVRNQMTSARAQLGRSYAVQADLECRQAESGSIEPAWLVDLAHTPTDMPAEHVEAE